MLKVLQPEGWAPAKGYANGIAARGEMVFVAGMIGWNGQCQFETDDFVAQCKVRTGLKKAPSIKELSRTPQYAIA
jgi:enamine deaminase RidA (YjgF/YER057c/UK114 family)